jgi:hypothetical protein
MGWYVGKLLWAGAATACLLCNTLAVAAQEAPMQVVQVSGLADPDQQSYRRMIKGMDAFEKYRHLAPQAELRYRLYPRLEGVRAKGTVLTIQGGNTSIPVALAEDLSFTLVRDEQALAEGAVVTTNRKDRSFAWGPEVRTPGLPPNTRRLGDIRLQCQIDRDARLLVGLKTPAYLLLEATLDLCSHTPRQWFYYAERAVFGVTLVNGQRRQMLMSDVLYVNRLPRVYHVFYDMFPLLYERTFLVPVGDTGWPDDTLLEIEYMDDDAGAVAMAATE